jgi:hypothetical protein
VKRAIIKLSWLTALSLLVTSSVLPMVFHSTKSQHSPENYRAIRTEFERSLSLGKYEDALAILKSSFSPVTTFTLKEYDAYKHALTSLRKNLSEKLNIPEDQPAPLSMVLWELVKGQWSDKHDDLERLSGINPLLQEIETREAILLEWLERNANQ